MDLKPAFELYYDPEPSAPESFINSSISLKPSDVHSPSHSVPNSSSSLSPSASPLTSSPSIARVVLGELPVRIRVNPFHPFPSHEYSSCGLRPTTCDSRLKHETQFWCDLSSSKDACDDYSETEETPEAQDNGSRGSSLPCSRRSTICSIQTHNGYNQDLRTPSLPSPSVGANDLDDYIPVPSGSDTGGQSPSPPPSTSSSSSTSSNLNFRQRHQRATSIDETKENVRPVRKSGVGRSKRHAHYQVGCQKLIKRLECTKLDYHTPIPTLSPLAVSTLRSGPSSSYPSRMFPSEANHDHSSPSIDPVMRRLPRSAPETRRGNHGPSSPAKVSSADTNSNHHRHRSLPSFQMRI
ncbi:hypothetical protein CROQUDRAFT_131619 [Cronartium quercuum f. sp. fusiforme G11]|uniref:Uncharacterized protein n=1 Tax=Cronartium quercuum f. sp. fusiforme G11 TaxID=708437 RepID=A0A9P6NKU8_9BASI|nr:hypothetical protein CROQUDRAFT_131619 [Cronartium quercuum f. sp. fusiforme G11]